MGHQYKITGGGYRFVASLLAVVALIVASLIPPSVHVAKADDDASAASVTPTAYAANYGQLVNAINGSQSAVIAITDNIAFTEQITLKGKKDHTGLRCQRMQHSLRADLRIGQRLLLVRGHW